MKKVLLSLSMLAAIMSANAQYVGLGGYDDFTTQTGEGNATGEYSTQFAIGANTYTAGMFWYTDAAYAETYTKTRANGVMTIAVDKDVEYSVVGVGFGDDNGDLADGTDFTFDITANKTLSVDLMASVPTTIAIQLEDINGVQLEISGQNNADNTKKKYEAAVTTTSQTFTFNYGDARVIDHTVGNNDPDFNNGYVCGDNYPADCPVTLATNPFDYTQVTKVNFLISGGTAYAGTVTFDNFKIGTATQLGLGTTSAAANLASTKVFPNPTENEFYVELNTKNNAAATIIVADLMGKQVATKTAVNGVNTKFETAGLAKGMYTVTYVLDGTPAKTELVVVK